MWRARMRRRLHQFVTPGYNPSITEVGFPVDGAHKTKQLLLESVSRNNLDYLLPAFRSKITSIGLPSIEKIQQVKDTRIMGQGNARFTEEEEAATLWEEFHFPYYLGKWNASSRRIYYIPTDLMLLLEVTRLKGLTFRNARLPFSSFGIALETPLVNEDDKELDFFLIGDCSKEVFAFYGLARSLSKVKLVDRTLRAKISEAADKGNIRRFVHLAEKEMGRSLQIGEHWDSYVDIGIEEDDMDEDLEVAMAEITKAQKDCWLVRFIRILFGLCAYMSTFTADNGSIPEVVQKTSYTKKVYAGAKDGPALVTSAEVLKVQSVIRLSTEEREIIRDQLSGRGGWEVKAHFREGYWRRPKGEGHNPDASKTVWVRPTLVRRDRLPDNTLPLGAEKVLYA